MKILSGCAKIEGMRSAEGEKVCLSCEGRISLGADVCPFCATHQAQQPAENSFQAPLFQSQSLEDSLTSLYTPPYQGKRPQFDSQVELPQTSSLQELEESTQSPYKEAQVSGQPDPFEEIASPKEQEEPTGSGLIPVTLLLAGVNIGVIGLLQLFFSKDGVLRLEWNANYWFFYLLFSGPLFYFGAKHLRLLKD